MDSVEKFRKNLKALMDQQNLNPSSMGRAAGVSRQYISQLQAHERVPTIAVLDKIANALGVPGWAMIAGDDAEKFIKLIQTSADDAGLLQVVDVYLKSSTSQRQMLVRVVQGMVG